MYLTQIKIELQYFICRKAKGKFNTCTNTEEQWGEKYSFTFSAKIRITFLTKYLLMFLC